MPLTAQEIAKLLGGRIVGMEACELDDVASLENAGERELSFAESRRQLAALKKSAAAAILINADLASALGVTSQTLIVVDDPQAAFIQAMLLFRPPRARQEAGISPRAEVHPTARLGAGCLVHSGAQIGPDVVIGDRCEIGPGVIIGPGCEIGEDCQLYAGVVLYPNVILHNRILVHAHAVLGADGFGYRLNQGRLQKIPHTGRVIVEDDVEIGAGTTIDRGMIESTVIGQGTKLDNQVMIAHNCRLGRHNAFASQVGLAGSVTTGDYVQMGGQVGVADHCRIGDQVRLGGKAGVAVSITEAGIYHGQPAIPEKEAIRNHLNSRKIPQIREQLERLTRQVVELQEQLETLTRSQQPAESPPILKVAS